MGTNYYAVKNRPSLDEPIHIGKLSYGWLFCFQDQDRPHNDPPVVWHSYDDVKNWLRKYTVVRSDYSILDEYDRVVSFEGFFKMVEDVQKDEFAIENPDNFKYGVRNVGGYRFDDRDFC